MIDIVKDKYELSSVQCFSAGTDFKVFASAEQQIPN